MIETACVGWCPWISEHGFRSGGWNRGRVTSELRDIHPGDDVGVLDRLGLTRLVKILQHGDDGETGKDSGYSYGDHDIDQGESHVPD